MYLEKFQHLLKKVNPKNQTINIDNWKIFGRKFHLEKE